MEGELHQVVVEILDTRLVTNGWVGVLTAPRPVARILTRDAVHVVETLRFGVPGLKIVVGDRPGRREPAVVLDHPEVLGAQAEQRGTVELGVAAHVVVLFGGELVAVLVEPFLRAVVLRLHENRGGLPVVTLPR